MDLPHTVMAVTTDVLLDLETETKRIGLGQAVDPEWLVGAVAPDGVHFLHPALVHRLDHRPDVLELCRCAAILEVHTGEQVFSLLDVLPARFQSIASYLSPTCRRRMWGATSASGLRTLAEWAAGTCAQPDDGLRRANP